MYELKVKELKLEFEVIFVLFLQIFMSILWKIISWNAKKLYTICKKLTGLMK